MRVGWLLLCLAGCGRVAFDPVSDGAPDATPEEVPPYVSGSRLRAVVVETETGGAAELDRWFDTQLQIECRFERESDGTWRCLPFAEGRPAWSDAACTQPLLELQPPQSMTGCGSQRYARVQDAGPTVYETGAAWTGTVYRDNGGSTCVQYTGTLLAHWERGPEVPSSAFVSAEEVVSPYHRLSFVSLHGEDGSRQRLPELHDTSLDARCVVEELGYGRAWCLPESTVGSRSWSDPACSQPVIIVARTASLVYVGSYTLCGFSSRLLETAGEISGTYYQRLGASCVATSLPPGWHAYLPGPERSLDPYVSFTRKIVDGTAPVSSLVWESEDGTRVPAQFRHDAARNMLCNPTVEAASQRLTCAPVWGAVEQTFSDAACTMQRPPARPSCREDIGATWFPNAAPPLFSCEGLLSNIRPYDGAPISGPSWELTDAGCTPVDPSVELYPMGTTFLDISELPLLQTRRE